MAFASAHATGCSFDIVVRGQRGRLARRVDHTRCYAAELYALSKRLASPHTQQIRQWNPNTGKRPFADQSYHIRLDAGQAALPGGKADTLSETPLQTARREAHEEIGLPLPIPSQSSNDASSTKYSPPTPGLPSPFTIDHLCQLPSHLARTELGVKPCVAFLSAPPGAIDKQGRPVDAEAMLIPRLDAKEVAAVFTAPLHNFLRKEYGPRVGNGGTEDAEKGTWYSGSWIGWYEGRFRMHNFYVPAKGQLVTRSDDPQASPLPYRDHPSPSTSPQAAERFRVFGMTARILVDCARVAYAEEPEFEHNSHFGDEPLIENLLASGRMESERAKGAEFIAGERDVKDALRKGHKGGML